MRGEDYIHDYARVTEGIPWRPLMLSLSYLGRRAYRRLSRG